MECTINPEKDANIRMNCDVGAARFIDIPSATTINGTKIRPPPIPNKLDIIPAKKLAPAEKISKRQTKFAVPLVKTKTHYSYLKEIITRYNSIYNS